MKATFPIVGSRMDCIGNAEMYHRKKEKCEEGTRRVDIRRRNLVVAWCMDVKSTK